MLMTVSSPIQERRSFFSSHFYVPQKNFAIYVKKHQKMNENRVKGLKIDFIR